MSCSGTVKFFNVSKGFGFIIRDDGENDIFVHTSDVQGLGLNENDTVKLFILREDEKARIFTKQPAIPREGPAFGGGLMHTPSRYFQKIFRDVLATSKLLTSKMW